MYKNRFARQTTESDARMDFLRHLFSPERRSDFAVAALLDDEHEQQVREIWDDLREELGIQHTFTNAIPHVTHLQAKRIEEAELRQAMTRFAAQTAPYILRTAGLGIFTGEQTAVYISVVRNPALSALQTNMISSFASYMDDMSQQHFINLWMPHITLLLPEMLNGRLPQIVELLARRNFTWEMRISRLVLLRGVANDPTPPFTVTLNGAG